MVPKKIHYFWFGDAKKSPLIDRCIESWKRYAPDFQIIEWNEQNYDVEKNSFTRKAFAEKKWAFLSDYARLDVLHREGGVYMDTDMELLKPLNNFLNHALFLGMESANHVNASIVGSQANHWLISEVLVRYQIMKDYTPIPVVMTDVLKSHTALKHGINVYRDITIYPPSYFYPFAFGEKFNENKIQENTHTIHWWDHSWGSPAARLAKRLGVLKPLVTLKHKILKHE